MGLKSCPLNNTKEPPAWRLISNCWAWRVSRSQAAPVAMGTAPPPPPPPLPRRCCAPNKVVVEAPPDHVSRPGAEPGAGRARGGAEPREIRGLQRRGEVDAGAAAGHDSFVPVLPAAAGRAPLPRPRRYWPRVLTGGSQARAGPAGPRRRAACRASRHLPLAVPRCGEAALAPGASPGLQAPQAWPTTLVGGPLLTPVALGRSSRGAGLGNGPRPPFPARGAERLGRRLRLCPGGSGREPRRMPALSAERGPSAQGSVG